MKIRSNSQQTGISLIEVLVVLVLLLIGILSVIRLFPPGFLINKQVGEATAAGRLCKEEADRYANSAANLMDAIVPVIPIAVGGGYQFAVDTGATPDDITEASDTNLGVWAPYFSDVNKTRRILGEHVRIPLPTTTTVGRGSIYMLSAGPFMDVPWNGGSGSSIVISGNPLVRRDIPQSQGIGGPQTAPAIPNLRNSEYAIDYSGKQIVFKDFLIQGNDTASDPREFTLTISYYDRSQPGTPPVTLVDIVVSQPSGPQQWIPIPGLPANAELVQFSETVARKFKQVAPGTAWSTTDPYQFYLDPGRSPRIGAANGVGANMGVVVFNPLGHDWPAAVPGGTMPLTARIDYDVLDWHIIHEDRAMPSSTPYVVPLALKDIKKRGDFEADQTVYDDIFYGVDRTGASAPFDAKTDFIVYNIATGDFVDPLNYTVNYKDGSVTFTDNFGNANASGTFRVYYRAHGDWALVIQKATGIFRPKATAQPTYNEYYLGTGGGGGIATRMYFPLSEAGKTVSLREFYYRKSDGTRVKVANESYQINAARLGFDTAINGPGGQPLTWIDIHDKHTDAVSWDNSVTGYAVLGVQGISFRTRVMWRNGSTVSTASTGNVFSTRWRKVDLDSVLTRAQ